APSHFLRQRYVEWGIPPEKIHFQEYGRPRVIPRPDVPRQRTRLGFFGQINPFNGVDVLLRAMQILAQEENCPAHLWVHGADLEYQPESSQKDCRRLAAA